MRILLVAYEFPPSASPGALRWSYLSREFATLGHDVHVLMPSVWNQPATSLECPPGVTVHPTFAGPFQGLSRWLAARQPGPPEAGPAAMAQGQTALNWKGRVFETLKQAAARVVFPDI